MDMKQTVPIVAKGRTFRGHKYPDQDSGVVAHIERNQSIHMVGRYNNQNVDITFKLGDTAEYGSYNLHYLGTIEKITDKGVTILPRYERNGKTKRLSLNEFMWRNHNFNLAEIEARNAETSMCI
jgi:hypothetical protein